MIDDGDLIDEETEAAAAEAAGIGGRVDSYGVDEAERAVTEAGGGVAEGFEVAEEALIENAEHQSGLGDPIGDAITPELESDLSNGTYGEPDELDSTETKS